MASRRVAALSDTFAETLVSDAERRVREAGAVPAAKLVPKGITRDAQARFFEALAQRGLERTGSRIRIPPHMQLTALLATESTLPLAALPRRLAGVTAAEAKRATARLLADRQAVVVVRKGKELLALPSEALLSEQSLDALCAAVKQLEALVKAVKPRKGAPPRTLHHEDVAAAWALFPCERPAPRRGPVRARAAVQEALQRMADPRVGLVRIPELVRSLQKVLEPAQVGAELLALHADGIVELRPESGVGLLSAQDAALCPRGMRGTVLSFARMLVPGGPPEEK